jgi:hypothetical protein
MKEPVQAGEPKVNSLPWEQKMARFSHSYVKRGTSENMVMVVTMIMTVIMARHCAEQFTQHTCYLLLHSRVGTVIFLSLSDGDKFH